MNLSKRIEAFSKLGNILENNKIPENILEKVEISNPWFTKENVLFAVSEIAQSLQKNNIERWLQSYKIPENNKNKTIAVVTAGNIPLVGFHDFLSVLITGNNLQIKLSSKDNILLKYITEILIEIEPEFKNKIKFTEQIQKPFDAIIATGSDNSAKYFSYYFDKYPNIIRKNRNSIAILSGNETKQELENLADDIFMYFGLGCRSISKIYIPENYDIRDVFPSFEKYKDILQHNKYANNYDYNRSIFMMNNIKFFDNGFSILKEDFGFSSPISVIYYEKYDKIDNLFKKIQYNSESIQVIVSNISERYTKLGQAQKPQLSDYADNIDTIEFLLNL